MSEGESSAPQLRGEFFAARIQYLKQRFGADAIVRSLAELPEEDRERLRNLDPRGWYPLSALIRFDRAAVGAVASGDPGLAERFGEASSQLRNRWLGDHASLVSPHAFLARVAEEHREFHTYGRVTYRRTGFTEAEIAFHDYPEPDQTQCLATRGYLRASLETLTGASVQAEERQCQLRGDACCLFWVRWKARTAGEGDSGVFSIPSPS